MSDNGRQSPSAQVPQGSNRDAIIKELKQIVQDFTDKKIGKSEAIVAVMQAIPTAFFENSSGASAAKAYIEQLDFIEKAQNGGGGRRNSRSRSHARSPSRGRRRSRSPVNAGGHGRGRRPSQSPGPDGGKRRRLDESKLPWAVGDILHSATLSSELRKTRELLEEFALDKPRVLASILNSSQHPPFPRSEWQAVIEGGAVDLNKVISHYFAVAPDRHRSESIGDGVEIMFGSSVPVKSVTSQFDWLTAWGKTEAALTFVFPHRARELAAYWQYVSDLFTSSADTLHPRIILLDHRIRNEVASRRDLELSECHKFAHWERSFLSDHGAGYLEHKSKEKEIGGNGRTSRPEKTTSVATNTAAPGAAEATPSTSASALRQFPSECATLEPRARRPRYLREFVWGETEEVVSPTAVSTQYDPPLPQPGPAEFTPWALETIRENQHLFKIVTPIKVDTLGRLLVKHPNPPFVQSVLTGLRTGFWPWADTKPGVYPCTYDVSHCPLKSERETLFIREQRDTEVELERFSPPFGPELKPGMYSEPIHAVPKPQSEKLRMVVNHKHGEYSLNSMIPREQIAGAKLDSLKNLGNWLLELRRRHGPNVELVVWKSDVSQAYRRLPMHVLWQLKQIVTIDGMRHVDRCNNFGSRGAARIFISFMALVMWIAINERGITSFLYMDDDFGAGRADEISYYSPYNDVFPSDQVATLQLWDEIGLPHEAPKQVWGPTLTIIGFEVDANTLTFTMPEKKRAELIAGVEEFIRIESAGRRHPLREFQRIAGWLNWSFNVYPLLKPALSHVYDKMSGKSNPDALVYVNRGVVRDLKWFVGHLEVSSGIHLLEVSDWDAVDADITAFGDASLAGIGFYLPDSGIAFQSPPPAYAPTGNIFFLEALCVLWVLVELDRLVHAAPHGASYRRILVWTDSQNTFDIFNSLRAKPQYNEILKAAMDIVIRNDWQLRVGLLPGKKNVVADALSRWRNEDALASPSSYAGGGRAVMEISLTSRQPVREPWTVERLTHERSVALGHVLDASTSATYSSALNSYLTFCKMHNFPIEPTADTLSFFVVYMCHHIKPDSVDSYLSGICSKLEDFFPNIHDIRTSRLVSKTLQGCKRLRGSPTKRKNPLAIHHLQKVIRDLDDRIARGVVSHNDRLFAAQILTGFYALLRLGELTYPDNKAIRNPRKVSQRDSVVCEATAYKYFLPSHKADAYFEGNTLIIQRIASDCDPHRIFLEYLKSRDEKFPLHPQLWLRSDGSVPVRSWFMHRMRYFFLKDIAGQSMRAGGATRLAELGAMPHVIQAAGRWASSAFWIYIRKNPIVLQGMIHGQPAFGPAHA
uniref:Reverse transcriptase domain-containing protein n=1 Tax=Mycena chlorophos TaxID=658473 RepID=A0ABQ0MBB1_MYCCL|nr:predicted protein [Mycena chlorophos]